MRQKLIITGIFSAILFLATSCDKGCTCKYYDENNVLVEIENWESDMISEAECINMNGQTDVSITVDNEKLIASRVICTSGTSLF